MRGDLHDVIEPLAYFVWADRRAARHLHRRHRLRRGHGRQARPHDLLRPVVEGLKALDIAPDEVKDVIVTPPALRPLRQSRPVPARPVSPAGHRDGVRHRPVHVPRGACAFRSKRTMWWRWCGRCSRDAWCFTTATTQIAPGHHRAPHRRALEGAAVRAREDAARPVVLASDASHLYAHFIEGRVFPITYSVADTLEGYATLKRLADSPDHIVPGHDPRSPSGILRRGRDSKAGSSASINDSTSS